MALCGNTVEEMIWNYLISKGLNQYGVAGLMGNLYKESGLRSNNLENTYSARLGYSDEEYTTAVDNGTYTNFVNDRAGYGLAQWTYPSRKDNLLKYANACSVSISELEMQLGFLYKELSESYKAVLRVLTNATNILEASNAVLFDFERPARQDTEVQNERAAAGQVYYDTFAKEVPNMAEVKKDNTPDEWAREAVNWAVKNKILFGDEHGNYKLHDNCTRQEMLVFLKRLHDLVK